MKRTLISFPSIPDPIMYNVDDVREFVGALENLLSARRERDKWDAYQANGGDYPHIVAIPFANAVSDLQMLIERKGLRPPIGRPWHFGGPEPFVMVADVIVKMADSAFQPGLATTLEAILERLRLVVQMGTVNNPEADSARNPVRKEVQEVWRVMAKEQCCVKAAAEKVRKQFKLHMSVDSLLKCERKATNDRPDEIAHLIHPTRGKRKSPSKA